MENSRFVCNFRLLLSGSLNVDETLHQEDVLSLGGSIPSLWENADVAKISGLGVRESKFIPSSVPEHLGNCGESSSVHLVFVSLSI